MDHIPQSENSALQSTLPSPAVIHHKLSVRTNLESDSVFRNQQSWSIPQRRTRKESENAAQTRRSNHRHEPLTNNLMRRNSPMRGSNALHTGPILPASANSVRFPLKSMPPAVSEIQSPRYPEKAAISSVSASLISVYRTTLPTPPSPSPRLNHTSQPANGRAKRNKSSVDIFKVE